MESKVTHKKHVMSPFFEQIKSGKKTSEGRLNKHSNTTFKIDHHINFFNDEGEEVTVKIIDISTYKDFEETLANELRNLLPEVTDLNEGLQIYRSIYPNIKEEKRLGVIVVHFELV